MYKINEKDMIDLIEKSQASYSNDLTRHMAQNAAEVVINYLIKERIVRNTDVDRNIRQLNHEQD